MIIKEQRSGKPTTLIVINIKIDKNSGDFTKIKKHYLEGMKALKQ